MIQVFEADISRAATVAKAIASDFYNDRLNLSDRNGAPHGTWPEMPEVKYVKLLRDSGVSDRDVRLFLTFIAAMDRARDADRLWEKGFQLFQGQTELFEPAHVARISISQLQDTLREYGVSQRHERDSHAWTTIAHSLGNEQNAVSRALDSGEGNAIELLLTLGTTDSGGRPCFPLLKGPKVGPMWVRMLAAPGGAKIDDLDIIPVAVDVQVRRVTANLGVLGTLDVDVSLELARPAIQHIWRKAVEVTEVAGPQELSGSAALDPALWFFGKWGCSHCEKKNERMPISAVCNDHCQFQPAG